MNKLCKRRVSPTRASDVKHKIGGDFQPKPITVCLRLRDEEDMKLLKLAESV